MKGFFVKHTYRGIGQVVQATGTEFVVRFLESGESATFDRDAFEERELVRTKLPLQSRCLSNGRECSIDSIVQSADSRAPNNYDVTFLGDGLRARMSEVELSLSDTAGSDNPLSVLASLAHGGYSLFQVREKLVSALNQQLKQAGGLRALLSSRIDLRPHQAYVAGLVLLDSNRRFLLADEVGLGKTIEAGIVIHDTLINNPAAKILVVCPGTLTQQWLCELYSKFGGHVFKLLELHASEQIDWSKTAKLIAPFSLAAYEHAEELLAIHWDLVVIDEVHHLLSSKSLYDFALKLSNNCPALLLLSAIPAQRREDEFLRILGLLDPQRYTPEVVSQGERFRELFEAQRTIGRKLRLLRRRLDGITSQDFTKEETIEQATDLLTIPVLGDDSSLSMMIGRLTSLTDTFPQAVAEILHYVGDTYRINRRILRNRRARLVEEEQIVAIERKALLCPYLAEQLEQEVAEAVRRLIISAKQQGLRDELLATLARVLWHSTVHPNAICGVLEALAATEPGRLKDRGIDFLSHGYLCGYAEWDSYQRLLYKAVRQSLSDECLHEALACAMRWRRDHNGFTRYARLVKMLKEKVAKRGRLPKMLIFAGYPGVAENLVQRLKRDFGAESTTEFTSGLSREEKESSVKQFRTNSTTWLLVSDESGGEGRNFQFAEALIHFDTPWYVSRVEQRIGRLDRLGREKESHSEVVSEVIFDGTSVESGLVRCYDAGVGVYRRSISGLEFALRDVEARIVMTAIEDGNEGLVGLAKDIAAFSEEERARDESEALLDEASFDRMAAEKFRRIRHSEQNEIAIEEAFTEYLQLVASNRSVRRVADLEHPDGLWLLRSDEIHQIRGKLKNGVIDQATPFMGTFRRTIAQQRLDLHFFNLGHPLFDALCKLLFDDTVGRTYAVEVKDPSHKPWVGFEFVFCAAPDVTQLTNNIGLQNQARQLFAFQPVHVFCRADDFIEEDTEVLARIRQSIVKADKERSWWNLTKEKSLVFQDIFTSPNWEELIYRSFDSASKAATSRVSKEVDPAVATTNRQLNERIKQLCNANGEEFEIEQLRRLHKSLEDWRIQLDSVGFISINGRIHERTLNARR